MGGEGWSATEHVLKEHPPATIAFVRSGGERHINRPSRHQIWCRDLHDIAGVIHQKHDFLPQL